MDFLTLCQTLRREVGASGTGPTAVTSQVGEYKRIVEWIIKAERAVRLRWENWNFRWAEATLSVLATVTSYAMPTGIDRIDKTSLDETIEYLDWKDFRVLDTDADPSDVSALSVAPDKTIRVWPEPIANESIALEGFTEGSDLAVSTDVSIIPEKYHRIIVAQAKIYYAEYEEDQFLLESASAEYGYWLKLLEGDQLPDTNAAVGMGQETGDLRIEVL